MVPSLFVPCSGICGKHELQVTFVGSYSTKISAVIYLTEIVARSTEAVLGSQVWRPEDLPL